MGRFISADRVVPGAGPLPAAPHDATAQAAWAAGGGGPGDPQALNRYADARNNPLRYTDPSGHCPICPALPWLVTGLKALVDAATVIIGGYLVYDSAKHLAHPSASPLNYPDTGGNTAPNPPAPTPGSGHEPPRDRTLQTGGNSIRKSTADALNRAHGLKLHPREWGRALESLKDDLRLANNHHGKIMESGEYIDTKTGASLGNILDYLP